MSAAGSPASRKRPLVPGPASPAAASSGSADGGEAAGAGSGSPRCKRRHFPAGGAAALPAWPGQRATAAVAEMDQIKLHRQRLIVHGAALTVVAASLCVLKVMRRRASTQQLAPLRKALAALASAIHAASAPVEPHPDLYPTVMAVSGFTREQLLTALFYLAEGRGRGAAFLEMTEPHRALWMKQILAKEELRGSEVWLDG